jgi:6-phosphogluconolactonase
MTKQNSEEVRVYIGTYTGGKSEGIYVYRLAASGDLEFISVAKEVDNPSFLAIAPQQDFLYSVSEVGNLAGKPSGGVSAFSIDKTTGELTFLNQQASHGTSPCHLSIDATGQYILVANYGSGSAAVLPVLSGGELGEATDVAQHSGSGADPRRQKGPHAHSIVLDRTNRFAFVPDLGLDKIMIYQLDLTRGKLKPNDEPWAKVNAGSGPRHFTFHPGGGYAYVINELDSTLTAFTYDETNGRLREIQTISALPEDFSDTSHCADVHILPSGRFLYGSNRGHDSIVVCEIDKDTGKLTCVGYESTQGKSPRGFAIDPTGNFLLAANQNSDSVVTFRIHQETGELTPTGHITEVSMPVCLKMIQVSV